MGGDASTTPQTPTKKDAMNTTELEQRLQRLEGRINRYRLTTGLLGLGLIALVGIAAEGPMGGVSQELRTHKLVVVDAQGKDAVRLISTQHGGAFYILNKEGAMVVRAGAAEKGGKLALADDKGSEFVDVTAEDGMGQLQLSDKKGQKNLMQATRAK
jgi:hypothetical protein